MSKLDSLIEQAKEGDINAIATLLSRQLAPKNIRVQANQKSGFLNLLFEAEQTPSQTQLVPWTNRALNNLQPKGISVVRLYARIKGQSEFAWKTQIQVEFNAQDASNTQIDHLISSQVQIHQKINSPSDHSTPKNTLAKKRKITNQTKKTTKIVKSKPNGDWASQYSYKLEQSNNFMVIALSTFLGLVYFAFVNVGIIFLGILAIIPANAARNKGYTVWKWWCYGFIFIPLAAILVGALPPRPESPSFELEERERKAKAQMQVIKERLNVLLHDEILVFKQSASYRGGVKGFPKRLEEMGIAYITNSSFIFLHSVMDFKLFHFRIIDATLDTFQMDEVRAFLASGDVARQLQNTKNVVNIAYMDEDDVERNARFQIHGAALIQGEELNAQEFLNYLFEFKKDFYKKDAISKPQDGRDAFIKMKRLKQLLDQGIITQNEFENKKKKLLDDV